MGDQTSPCSSHSRGFVVWPSWLEQPRFLGEGSRTVCIGKVGTGLGKTRAPCHRPVTAAQPTGTWASAPRSYQALLWSPESVAWYEGHSACQAPSLLNFEGPTCFPWLLPRQVITNWVHEADARGLCPASSGQSLRSGCRRAVLPLEAPREEASRLLPLPGPQVFPQLCLCGHVAPPVSVGLCANALFSHKDMAIGSGLSPLA